MHDIFISYAKEDNIQAEQLAEALKAKGFDVWYDINIPTGTTFDNVIEEALDDTKCVVVLWSEHSIESEWVKVEAGEGKSRDILVPVLIEDVEIPLAFRRRQTASMTEWLKGKDDAAFDRLVEDIQLIIQGSKAPIAEEDEKENKHEKKKKPPPPTPPKPIKGKFGKYAIFGSVLIIALLGWWKISSVQKTNDETLEQVKQEAIEQENKQKAAAERDSIRRSKMILGEKFEGGIIFYIDETKEHGLIMAQGDQTATPIFWLDSASNRLVDKANAYDTGIYKGKGNTEKLVAKFGDDTYPAKICSDLVIDGFTDWYLPSQEELDLLYAKKDIGNFSDKYYWSSTEISNRDVYYRSFYNGRSYEKLARQTSYATQNKAKVRAIRKF